MNKTLLGILVVSVACYVWGFLYWGVSNVPYAAWSQAPNDAAVQESLRELLPESGTYYIPGLDHEDEQLASLFASGPVAFIHVNLDGRPMVDPTIMIGGMLLTVLIVSFMALFFKVTGASEFRDFARQSVIVGVLMVIAFDGGDLVWWQIPLEWKLAQAIYNFTLIILAGHLLGIFMKAKKEQPATS